MEMERTEYLHYDVVVAARNFTATAPNGDQASFTTMAALRKWVKWHRREHSE